jgi:NAD(P)-dependent dehydrogenase (short-subunit alcohol dehydrogenase family)
MTVAIAKHSDRLGKSALIFGAGRNVGETVTHFMAREGARVVVADVNVRAAEETVAFLASRGLDAIATRADALEEKDVAAATDLAVEKFGGLDVMMNMAGTVLFSSIFDVDVDEWRRAVVSFPTAGLLTTRHAADYVSNMRRTAYGEEIDG